LAFSNLFRFADPAQPILIANPDDAIFIPHIPMQQTPVQQTPEPDINNSEMNAQKQQHVDEIVEMLADGKITTEQASSLFEELSVDPSHQPVMELEPVLESESDNDDESNATYWLRTVAAWNAAAERLKNEKK